MGRYVEEFLKFTLVLGLGTLIFGCGFALSSVRVNDNTPAPVEVVKQCVDWIRDGDKSLDICLYLPDRMCCQWSNQLCEIWYCTKDLEIWELSGSNCLSSPSDKGSGEPI